jgi:UDP-N-acetylmuramate--alanine ligase
VAVKEATRTVRAAGEGLAYLRGQTVNQIRHYHFVGIGGCGMSGLAQVLRQHGQQVSGSDQKASGVTDRLRERGIAVAIGHDAGVIPKSVDFMVISAAVKEDNPELVWARRHGVAVYKYAQMLGELSGYISTLAIAGTHGKSTSSGWLAYMLRQAGIDASFVVGANVNQLGAGSGAGAADWLVVEACEYDRSFLNLLPRAAVILNIEADHLDYYRDVPEIIGAFRDFAGRVSSDGLLVVNGKDANVAEAIRGRAGRCETFNLDGPADWRAENLQFDTGRGIFDLTYQGRILTQVRLKLAGAHNVANALAVSALAREAGLTATQIRVGLEGYEGVGRRMTYKGQAAGVTVLDDYAHHPTEIRVTLEAIRARYQPRRLWCLFQPHQHSRTRFLMKEFALCFQAADVVLLPEIYFVRDSEQLRREVNAEQLAAAIATHGGDARYCGTFDRIRETLAAELRPGDVVVTMGAGDIGNLADELIRRL